MTNVIDESFEILLVEDNPGDVFLIRKLLRKSAISHTLHHVKDGEEALAFLYQTGDFSTSPRPSLILLDLNLPKKDGRQVLENLKIDPQLKLIPVIVLTGSDAPQDIHQSYERHANCYITKPADREAYAETIQAIEDFWLSCVKLPV